MVSQHTSFAHFWVLTLLVLLPPSLRDWGFNKQTTRTAVLSRGKGAGSLSFTSSESCEPLLHCTSSRWPFG